MTEEEEEEEEEAEDLFCQEAIQSNLPFLWKDLEEAALQLPTFQEEALVEKAVSEQIPHLWSWQQKSQFPMEFQLLSYQ